MKLLKKYMEANLIIRIAAGLLIGVILGAAFYYAQTMGFGRDTFIVGMIFPAAKVVFKILGNLFIGALRAIAPVLIFFLISSTLMCNKKISSTTVKNTIVLYIFGTFSAALIAVFINNLFDVALVLPPDVDTSDVNAASSLSEIVVKIFDSIVSNPIDAIASSKFLGVLFWSILFGIVARPIANDKVKESFSCISNVLTEIVKIIINFAPVGICGLVFTAIIESGIGIITDYGFLLLSYLTCAFFMFFVFNPLIVFCVLRKNPYPLVFRSIKDVGLTAFFVRSSAANIPMNMAFCKKLGLKKDEYSITIALGSTINMEGAAITIITLTLACCRALGVEVELAPGIVLSLIATISAVGASGVSGGSILLVPMACSLFGIGGDISASVVAVGFIIGVIQDSVETALNSSTDGLFTATVQFKNLIRQGEPYHKIIGGSLDDTK